MTDGSDTPAEYELLEPFIVCESEGGPYDDAAFVAGIRYQQIAGLLGSDNGGLTLTIETYEMPGLVPQLDLLAMRHGFVLDATPDDEGQHGYTLCRFQRPEGGDPDE